jgi:ribonuclease HII
VKTHHDSNWNLLSNYLRTQRIIIGIDEVGRGAWAGPVVAGAVILPAKIQLPGLNDSKLVSAANRLRLSDVIQQTAIRWGIGWVTPAEVDEHGLSWGIMQSGIRAMAEFWTPESIVILDGKWNYLKDYCDAEAIVQADSLVAPVSAGSIIAKVARDNYMAEAAMRYPGYGFDHHVGYGTALHKASLIRLGPSPIHRLSYKPLRPYAK